MRVTKWLVGFAVVLVGALAFQPLAGIAPGLLMAAGVPATTDTLNELMKITFDDTVISEVVTSTEALDLFPDGDVKRGPEGRWFESSQLYQNPGSVGSRSEGGFIPEPNTAKAENARISLKKVMGSLEETAEVLKKIKGDKAAFVNWAKEQFPRFKESLTDELDRQVLGDGGGIRARVNAGAPATTLAIDSAYGIDGYDHALMQFQRGMFLRAAPNADGSGIRDGVMEVLGFDWDNGALVVDELATALADDDFLFEGDGADNSVGKDVMGLLGLVDDGSIVETLQNIDRTEHGWFKSYVHDASGAPLTEQVLIRADREARFRGGGRADAIIISEEGFDDVWTDLKADRQINDPRSYTGGRKGIDILFGGTRKVNLRTARRMPSKLAFGLQRDQFRKFVMHEFEWDDTTGSIWKQVVTSQGRKDQFFAYGSMYMELGVKSAQRNWRVEDWADAA